MNSKLFYDLLISLYDKKFSPSQKIIIMYLVTKIIDGCGKYQSNFMNLMYDAINGTVPQKTLKEKLEMTNWFVVKIYPGKKNATTFYFTDKGIKMLNDSGVYFEQKYVA